MSDLIGKNIGQYQITEKIGAGGMATVFKAYQSSINRYVAIKVLPTQFAHDPNFVKRFAQEAKAVAALEHPYILPVYDFGTQEGLTYMVMRYVEGGTLAGLMGKPMSNERMVEVVGNMARALDYAHKQGVVHRDIKPSNVLIDRHGEVLLTDFGIAKLMQGSEGTQLTSTGSILGTPEYMSPEQAEGVGVDHRSDIYSLGVVLYELLTGQPPYRAETPLAVVLKHVREPLLPPRQVKSTIPEPFERIVIKAMAKNRDERYQSAAEMEQALKSALREIESGVVTTSIPSAPPSKTEHLTPATMSVTPAKTGNKVMGPLLIGGLIVVALLCAGAIGIFALLGSAGNSARGATPTSVAGEVTVSGDLFGSTPTAEPILEATATPALETTATPLPDLPTPTEQPLVLPTAEPAANSDTLPSGELTGKTELFRETFDSNINNWTIGVSEDEYGKVDNQLIEGRYRISQTAKKSVFSWEQLFDKEFSNFTLVVDAIPVEASTAAYGYGVSFRNDLQNNLYTFMLDQDTFVVKLLQNGEWKNLVDYTPLAAINVKGPNQLMVKADSSTLTFFVNGEQAASITDNTLTSGTVGLALDLYEAGDKAAVDFDNLTVYALDDQAVDGLSDGKSLGGKSVIIEEYFDSDKNGWATGQFNNDYSQNEVTIADGQYTLSVKAKQPTFVGKSMPKPQFADFILTLDATPRDDSQDYVYGVSFREDADGNSYTFEIGNDGLYAILIYDGDEWKKLKEWSSTNAIKPGQTNQLMVSALGNMLTFSVNGELLTTLEDDTLSKGKVGLLVDVAKEGVTAVVDFDNLIITDMSSAK